MKIVPKKDRPGKFCRIFECCYAAKSFSIALVSFFINILLYGFQQFRGIETGTYFNYFINASIFGTITEGLDLFGILFILSKVIFLVSIALAVALESFIRIHDFFDKEKDSK